MKTKRLGNSDLNITPIGFGAWAIGGSGWEFGWGEQDDKASIIAIHRALELGVNWIDTAAVYGTGHSEEVVAAALKSWSGPLPYVFTKCGLLWDDERYVHRNLKADSIRRECENSLRRLKSIGSIFTKSTGRLRTCKKGGQKWRSFKRKERSAGLASRTLMPAKCAAREGLLRSLRCNLRILWSAAKLKRTFFLIAKRIESA